jgi:hypothetical protein
MLAKPEEAAALRAHRSALSTKHLPTRDGNGFRRLILLLTASGVLTRAPWLLACVLATDSPLLRQ